MIFQECQSADSAFAVVRPFQRKWRYIRRVFQRYKKWNEMNHHHDELMRMSDRMLKDIGLSRADAMRMTQGRNFWKYVFRSEG